MTLFTPTILARDTNPEMGNSTRGEFQWIDQPNPNPAGWPQRETYFRFSWRDLETTSGNYSAGYTAIQGYLNQVASAGGRLWISIMSNNPSGMPAGIGWTEGGATVFSALPDYMRSLYNGGGDRSAGISPPGGTVNGLWIAATGGYFFSPDWNNATYLSRFSALLSALSSHIFTGSGGLPFNQDPRLLGLDCSGYGDFSEMHECNSNGCTQSITTANLHQIIDWNVSTYFPQKKIMMPVASVEPVVYAVGTYTNVGPRTEGIDTSDLASGAANLVTIDGQLTAAGKPTATGRWTTIPFVAEGGSSGSVTNVLNNIRKYHCALLASGGWGGTATGSDATWQQALREVGYRYQIATVTVTQAGSNLTVQSNWDNVNVATSYMVSAVHFQLRQISDNSQVAGCDWTSSLDLQTVLPTEGVTGTAYPVTGPVAHTDVFALPGGFTPGNYTFAVQVIDPSAVSPPMNLAHTGANSRAGDGSYPMGTLTVAAGGSSGKRRSLMWVS